ncbi:MAG TPA: gamma-glutamyl-gamma-aminobutyrate hydrolase family protein [Leptospiraceae bacterium]|nr:gamma-glutamyl-gamma-aminobutyrate hydrolase family protein [Leptospiraceae bacterium]
MSKMILIIDPFLKQPAAEAFNIISYLHHQVQKEMNSFESYIEIFFPLYSNISLEEYISRLHQNGRKIIGVISLGSYVNITDRPEWINLFGKDLKENIIEQSIPFLGICFSHQLFGWIYGSNVDYIQNRDQIPDGKYNEFRNIKVSHDRLKNILGGKSSFISKAKHEQEVKTVNDEFLEICCTGEKCRIEGLMHRKFPSFSVQSHPEEFHESGDGFHFIKNFIYFFINSAHK